MAKKCGPRVFKPQTLGWPWDREHPRYCHRQVRRRVREMLRKEDPEEFVDPNPRRINANWEGYMD